MKKLMIAMAFVAMTVSVAMAQTDKKACDNKECVTTEQCCAKAGQKCDKPVPAKRACAFEGLNLTDAQKEQLKAIRQEQAGKCQAAAKDQQAKKEAKKEARRNARKEYLEKVKAVLTHEQYVQYLENLATRTDNGIKKDMKRMGDRAPRQVKAAKLEPAKKVERK
ncbi:MAG: hypothetical protein K2O38_05600 [Muribaculaceae bacterium]|nr:hypothetical protein [Muribaculaceae bacterium]